jgi:hypothetical protein
LSQPREAYNWFKFVSPKDIEVLTTSTSKYKLFGNRIISDVISLGQAGEERRGEGRGGERRREEKRREEKRREEKRREEKRREEKRREEKRQTHQGEHPVCLATAKQGMSRIASNHQKLQAYKEGFSSTGSKANSLISSITIQPKFLLY